MVFAIFENALVVFQAVLEVLAGVEGRVGRVDPKNAAPGTPCSTLSACWPQQALRDRGGELRAHGRRRPARAVVPRCALGEEAG